MTRVKRNDVLQSMLGRHGSLFYRLLLDINCQTILYSTQTDRFDNDAQHHASHKIMFTLSYLHNNNGFTSSRSHSMAARGRTHQWQINQQVAIPRSRGNHAYLTAVKPYFGYLVQFRWQSGHYSVSNMGFEGLASFWNHGICSRPHNAVR